MTLDAAPLFDAIANAPQGGRAFWLRTDDGLRIRAAYWPRSGAKGTVILFNGRTEYIEKYGPAAAELAARGYATLTLDWRGQGLSDRLLPDVNAGHVAHFDDYQRDIRALMAAAKALDAPRPFHLLSHSMGGCIGLRALHNGLPVASAAFSAPMWGIAIAAWLRPLAQAIATVSGWFGMAEHYAPGTSDKSYLTEAQFAGNVLTSDPAMWEFMRNQITTEPGLSLSGPSLHWVEQALAECDALSRLPSPDLPALCALGTHERVVDPAPVHMRMARWPKGKLSLYQAAEHEIMMELPDHRQRFYDEVAALFDRNGR